MTDDSFMKSLFGGVVAEQAIFPYPEPSRPAADELHAVLDGIRRFAARSVDSARLDREEAISPEILAGMKELGLFGLSVPKAYGGAGLDMTGYCRALQEVATVDGSLAMMLSAHGSLAVTALTLFAPDELKSRFMPRLASGEVVGAFALAEVGAGSDAASIQTRADRDGDLYVLSGEKAWVTNGDQADLFVVFARTSPRDEGAKPKLTAFLVERSPGVRRGPAEEKLGVRAAATTALVFDKVRVPADQVLGDVGRGFKVATAVLGHARISLAATCIGKAKRLLRMSIDRVNERKAFGRSISEFGLMRDKIAQMSADIFALESLTYLTTGLVDAGTTDVSIESAIGKVFGSETLWRVANEASQIAGALSYMRSQPWERLLRDARIPMIYEGTNEILRCFIALSGMQGPGREIQEVSKAMREPIKGFGLLSDFAIKKARTALGRERMTKAHPMLAREAVLFEEYTAHLAKGVDKVLRRHGDNIAEMQYTQKRVADLAIDLYALAAVITRTSRAIERRGEEGSRREIDLASVFATSAKRRMAENVAAMDENDDELRKSIAQRTCTDGGYPLDIL
ncbi:MAG: Acyl-CoA dehydrogenase [Labilithrix sp.]|nr:Acyl-CoA dehydrogenase [Labilithrix sp.]